MRKIIITLAAIMFVCAGVVFAAEYKIDAAHSTLGFAVGHLSVGTTRGAFTDYEGTITFDPEDFSTFGADVKIEVVSIDTKVEARDNHLRGEDFFHAEEFPEITFQSSRLEKRGGGQVIVGDLTIKGVTKQLTIPVSLSGPVKSPFGSTAIGIAGETVINRQDFGVTWNKKLDNGGLMVDDQVRLVIEIEAHTQG